jgi:predicted metal-dependent peptidase
MKYLDKYNRFYEAKKKEEPEDDDDLFKYDKEEAAEKEEKFVSKELDQQALAIMKRVFARISTKHRFFLTLLTALRVAQSTNLRFNTMATDGYFMLYDPNFVKKTPVDELIFTVCHELLHCALRHFSRQGQRDANYWNKAADYAINYLLFDTKTGTKPAWVLYDEKYVNWSAESIYADLTKDLPPPKQGGQGGQGQQGQGKGKGQPGQGKGMPGDTPGEILKPGSIKDGDGIVIQEGRNAKEEAKEGKNLDDFWRDQLKKAFAKSSGKGTGSSGLDRYLESDGLEPQVDWKKEMEEFVQEITSKLQHKMPSRRFVHSGQYIWGFKRKEEDVYSIIPIIDTSGSIGDAEVKVFGDEIKGIIKGTTLTEAYVMSCDDAVTNVDYFGPDTDSKWYKGEIEEISLNGIKGGGGTDFRPPFQWINDHIVEEQQDKPGIVIYFTDMCGDFPDSRTMASFPTDYEDRVLWVAIDNQVKAPFGRTLHITRGDIR